MLRVFAFTLIVAVGVSCMKMRETVERTVMVRTTGSDLHPEATGFIYKKQNDGEESVIAMGESEVMEQLSKLYTQPQAYVAPVPIKKPVEIKNDDSKENLKEKERVIPVKEKAEDDHDDNVDGIAEDDYKKIFDEYTAHYGDNTNYDDYLHDRIGHFDDGIYQKYKGSIGKDNEGYKAYGNKNYYNDGGVGDYHNQKYESYSISGKGSDKNDDAGGYHYDNRNLNEGDKNPRGKQKSDRYFKVVSKDEKYKNYGSYGDGGKTFHGYGNGNKHHADGEHDKNSSEESGQNDKASSEDGDNHSAEEDSSREKHGDFGSKGRQAASNGYGFKIEH